MDIMNHKPPLQTNATPPALPVQSQLQTAHPVLLYQAFYQITHAYSATIYSKAATIVLSLNAIHATLPTNT